MTTLEPSIETAQPPQPKLRRALPWWTQLLILLTVFASGGIAGSMITARAIHSRMEQYRQHAPVFSQDIVMRLRMRLALSDEQANAVQEIITRRHAKLVEYRNAGSQRMHTEFDALIEEVAGVLDDSQENRWRSIADHVRRTFLPASISHTTGGPSTWRAHP